MDGSMLSPYHMTSTNYAQKMPSAEFYRQAQGSSNAAHSPEDQLNQRLMSHSKRLQTQARVQQNKEKLMQEQQ